MKIFLAGHSGLLGSHILEKLTELGYKDQVITKSHRELDLTDQASTFAFYAKEKPTATIMSAGRVAGIIGNSLHNAEMLRENLLMAVNTISAASEYNCKKFCFLGSSCIYPRLAPQPIKEEYLLTGALEKTNYGYATGKIAGVQLIKTYRQQYRLNNYYSLMPTNLYGVRDRFDETYSHVLPALITKFHNAKINNLPYVQLIGTGNARREFLNAKDCANIVVKTLFMDNVPEIMNVGVGEDLTINDLALLIKKVVGYEGDIRYDSSQPDGTPRKLLDISKMRELGLKAEIDLETGIRETYEWYKKNQTGKS